MRKKNVIRSRAGLSFAFTIFEIIVAVAVIGILATMALPRLTKKSPKSEWSTVLDEVNNVLYYARQEAISNQKTYRLHFQTVRTDQDFVDVEVEEIMPKNTKSRSSKLQYTKVKSFYFNPLYKFPSEINIEAIYKGKDEQLQKNKNHAYCHIIPNGLVEEIIIHLKRTEPGTEKASKKTFVVSPFFGRFEVHDDFLKPKDFALQES